MNSYTTTKIVALSVIATLVIAAIGGWISNIIKLAQSGFDPLTGMVVLRAIGVFIAPIGSILGFL